MGGASVVCFGEAKSVKGIALWLLLFVGREKVLRKR